jgi:hypothetical protein
MAPSAGEQMSRGNRDLCGDFVGLQVDASEHAFLIGGHPLPAPTVIPLLSPWMTSFCLNLAGLGSTRKAVGAQLGTHMLPNPAETRAGLAGGDNRGGLVGLCVQSYDVVHIQR